MPGVADSSPVQTPSAGFTPPAALSRSRVVARSISWEWIPETPTGQDKDECRFRLVSSKSSWRRLRPIS
jgi:hypothetical protein